MTQAGLKCEFSECFHLWSPVEPQKVLNFGAFQTPPVQTKNVQAACQEPFGSSTSIKQGQQRCDNVSGWKGRIRPREHPLCYREQGEAYVLDRNIHIGSHTHRPDKGTLSKASNSHFSVPRTCWCGLRERLPLFVQEFCVQQAWSSCGWHLNPDKKEEMKPQVSCGDSQLCNCFQPRRWVLAFAFCGSPGSKFEKTGLYSHLSSDTHGTQPGVRRHMWGRLQCFLQWMGILRQVSWEIRSSRCSIERL